MSTTVGIDDLEYEIAQLKDWSFGDPEDLPEEVKGQIIEDYADTLKGVVDDIASAVWHRAAMAGAKVVIEELTSELSTIQLCIDGGHPTVRVYLLETLSVSCPLAAMIKDREWDTEDRRIISAKLRELADELDATA